MSDRKDKLSTNKSMIQRNGWGTAALFALLAATVLTGCNASHEYMNTNMASTMATAELANADAPTTITGMDPRPVIVCFGDSLTAGYGVDEESSYPANLQRNLDAAGYHYRVVNLGISGETTKDGLNRVDRVLALKPAVVVVEFGGNDGLRGVPVASSRSNLDAILNRLKHGETHIAMAGITLPPQYSAPYIRQFNETYTVLAKKYTVPLLPFMLKDVYGVPGSIQQDGIHPTAQGCIQVAKNVLGLIRPLLKK